MDKTKNEGQGTQGEPTPTNKKGQKKSVSHALKAMKTHMQTLKDNELLLPKEIGVMEEIIMEALKKYVKKEYGF